MNDSVKIAAKKRSTTGKRDWRKPKFIRQPLSPVLRLTPAAWAKLLYLRDAGPTEIGGLGISAPGEPLLLADIVLVRQRCDWASVRFDDAAVADLFDQQIDGGRRPEEFARVWVHTHPGESPSPSATDEETFERVFGACDWAVMFILAQGGRSYARLRFGVGPGGSLEIPVEVDFAATFSASDHRAWAAAYAACVVRVEPPRDSSPNLGGPAPEDYDWFDDQPMLRSSPTEDLEYEAYW